MLRQLTPSLLIVLFGASCGSTSPCASVTCSFHGSCAISGVTLYCECDPGFIAAGLECVRDAAPPSSCVATGSICSVNGDCCNFQRGNGSCVSGRCADSCVRNSDCNSGCCAQLVSGNRACAPATSCGSTCRAVNSSCTVNNDCCTFRAGTGFCVDGFCADSCTRNSDCVSNCCAPLVQGGSTCNSPSFCP